MAEWRSAGGTSWQEWGIGLAECEMPDFILKTKIVTFCFNVLSCKLKVNKLILGVYLNQIVTVYRLFVKKY